MDGVSNSLDGGILSGLGLVLVKFHELGEIELWLLEDLDLSDHAVVLKWEDLSAFVLDLFANFFVGAKIIY